MLYFKDASDGVYSIPDLSVKVPAGSTQITEAEWIANLYAPTLQDQKAVILAQTNALDPIDQLRPMRDFLLQLAIKEAAALGVTEPQLYAVNIGYRRMKDREAELEVLRTQLKALP